MMMSQNKAAC